MEEERGCLVMNGGVMWLGSDFVSLWRLGFVVVGCMMVMLGEGGWWWWRDYQ